MAVRNPQDDDYLVPRPLSTLTAATWAALMQQPAHRTHPQLLSLAKTPEMPGLSVSSYVSDAPCCADEILQAALYTAHGVFQHLVPHSDMPRVVAVVRIDGQPVAHAMLHPIDVLGSHLADLSPTHDVFGLVGIYVAPRYRHQHLARLCAAALAERLRPLMVESLACAAEQRVLDLFAPVLPCLTVARWSVLRMDSPRHITQRDARVPLSRNQSSFWNRMLKAPASHDTISATETRPALEIFAACARGPSFETAIVESRLDRPGTEFSYRIQAKTMPQTSVICTHAGKVVALATLMPTRAYLCGSHDTPEWAGVKVGLVDVRVDPTWHQHGLDVVCLESIARRVHAAEGAQPVACVAEVGCLAMAQAVFTVPVFARWNHHRLLQDRRAFVRREPNIWDWGRARMDHHQACRDRPYVTPLATPLAAHIS